MTFNDHLNEWFKGNKDAVDWVLAMWEVTQLWDDLIDGDEAKPDRINYVFQQLLVGMPENNFYATNRFMLTPVIMSNILSWHTANELEKTKNEDDINKAYVLRAEFYNLIIMVASLTGGFEWAKSVGADIWRMYGETNKELHLEVINA